MKLSPPTKITFWVSVVVGVLGLLGTFAIIPALGGMIASWLLIVAWLLLILGLLVKGL